MFNVDLNIMYHKIQVFDPSNKSFFIYRGDFSKSEISSIKKRYNSFRISNYYNFIFI